MASNLTINMAAKASVMEPEPTIAIVEDTFDPEESEFPFGKRWGGELFRLSAEHLEALQAGKTLALDVMGEYVTFIALDKNSEATNRNDEVNRV